MKIRTRLAATAAGAALGVAVALASPTTAHAGTLIGGPGSESRCDNHPTALLCLYYSTWDQAYWATDSGGNLSGATFLPGTGLGSGQRVSNATKMACYIGVDQCRSYVFVNQGGDFDWTHGGWKGDLSSTWKDLASVWILV
jgi:hypothetical protein